MRYVSYSRTRTKIKIKEVMVSLIRRNLMATMEHSFMSVKEGHYEFIHGHPNTTWEVTRQRVIYQLTLRYVTYLLCNDVCRGAPRLVRHKIWQHMTSKLKQCPY